MNDFRSLLVESEYTATMRAKYFDKYPDLVEGNRQFAPLKVGAFEVSIQASASHYCTPRITTNDLTRYTTWEVWCGPQGDTLRALFDHAPRPAGITAAILEHFGHEESEPASQVPTDVVQAYLDALECVAGGGP